MGISEVRVLFRVDASLVVGSGHLMRCLTLARQLQEQGAHLTFACRDLPGAPLQLIPAEYELLRLPALASAAVTAAEAAIDGAADSRALAQQLGGRQFDWCVIDHYGLDALWHRNARGFARHLMVIDDLANRPLDCDLLLDQGFDDQSSARYAPWLQQPAQALFGPEFALLREEFLLARARTAPRSGALQRVLVFFTGGDDGGELFKALQALVGWRAEVQVDVVIGAAHPQGSQLAALCQTQGWQLHCQIDYMARLLAEADLVIGAAGSSSWERCALGVPALVAVLADNQRSLAAGLHSLGAAINLGDSAALTPGDYRRALDGLDATQLAALSVRGWALVDGLGAGRVSLAMLDILARPQALAAEGRH